MILPIAIPTMQTVISTPYTTTYSYDSANQLIREDNQKHGRTYTWTYDNAGNILYYKTYTYTREALGTELDGVEYGYDKKADDTDTDYWGDLLISYDGTAVTYEYQEATDVAQEDGTTKTCNNIGNPESLNGRSYVWEHGRQLKSTTKDGTTWTYTYNNAGLRTSRSNGTTTYKYIYDGSALKQMTIINGNDSKTVDFTYDAAGTPLTMTYNGVTYYYVTNLQGDVVGLLDGNGNRMISYHYTAYGQGYINANESSMTATLASVNPLGYRSYVHDLGTGLYYLQSRYYDPAVGRFINADVYTSTGQGFIGNNMFAYCGNNPVNRVDPTGKSPDLHRAIKRIVDAVVSAVNKVFTVHHAVPLYDQGGRNLCWAYCQIMVEDYESGIYSEPSIVDDRAIALAKEAFESRHLLGNKYLNAQKTWNDGNFPTNGKGLVPIDNFFLIYIALQDGPLYAYYWDGKDTSEAHMVVITGANLFSQTVYTNNPQGYPGFQTYEEFINGYYSPYGSVTPPLNAIIRIY